MLTQSDIEWAESVAGRKLSMEEIQEFKTEFEAWLAEMEAMDELRDASRWE